jgi:hypothetical protein
MGSEPEADQYRDYKNRNNDRNYRKFIQVHVRIQRPGIRHDRDRIFAMKGMDGRDFREAGGCGPDFCVRGRRGCARWCLYYTSVRSDTRHFKCRDIFTIVRKAGFLFPRSSRLIQVGSKSQCSASSSCVRPVFFRRLRILMPNALSA